MTVVLSGVAAALAVLLWPSRSRPLDRLAGPRPGAGSVESVESVESAGSAGTAPLPADLVMELVACGLEAGLTPTDALAAAGTDTSLGDVVGRLRLGLPASQAWAAAGPDYARLAQAMMLADRSGAPAAAVVRRAAADSRAAHRERVELAAARLGVRLVLPLGLAVLPGFVLLAVAPIVIGLAGSVLGQEA